MARSHVQNLAGRVSSSGRLLLRTGPVLLIGTAREGRGGCLLLLEGAQGTHWDGRPVDAHDIALLAPGSSFAAAHHAACACAFVSGGTAEARDALLPPGRAAQGRLVPVPVQRCRPETHARVAAIIRTAEQLVAAAPGMLCGEEAQRALRASLLDAMQRLFLPVGATDQPRRRQVVARHRIVREADAYLCANPMRPVYTEEVCAALGVSTSGLHEAFHVTFSISPQRYLKLRRMSLARAALLSRSGPWRSVKAAALSHGFWHLGQFAHDYRMIYGESPCETLARARWREG
jgi:AraC family transcriptional regulator, ethanolamine operon transcriptional activator